VGPGRCGSRSPPGDHGRRGGGDTASRALVPAERRSIARAVSVLAAALLFAFGRGTAAQEAARWEWDLAAFLWGTDLRGTIRTGPEAAPLTADFSDRLNHLEVGLLSDVEARRGRWGILFAPFYTDFDRAVGPRSGPFVQVDSTQIVVDLAGAYRVSETRGTSLDAIVGARYNQLNTVLKSQGSPSYQAVRMWVDPFVGGRVVIRLGDRWSWRLRGDLGGFDVGSTRAWSANTQLRFQMTRITALALGFGIFSTDYRAGQDPRWIHYDVRVCGEFVGAAFRL